MQTGRDESAQQFQWQSNKYNPRGKKLFDFIKSAGLLTVNIGRTPTFVGPRISAVIDLKIYTTKSLELITD